MQKRNFSNRINETYWRHCLNALADHSEQHVSISMKIDPKTGKRPYFKWINTILGNVKTSLAGTYKSRKIEYSARYLAEFQYRINRRFDLETILTRLIHACCQTPPLPGVLLRVAANST